MKSNPKIQTIIIFITLGTLLVFSPIINNNLTFKDKSSVYIEGITLDNENFRISAVSGKIHINNNWTDARSAGICMGNGTYSEPYVIEDLEIDGGGSGSCILIENSNVFFRIEDCTLYNSGGYPNAGIFLNNTDNGLLIDNDCSPNFSGISLYNSHNNTVSRNTANNYNIGYGILLYSCDNNTISGNTASYNLVGISISIGGGNNNEISENNIFNNVVGIQIWLPGTSDNNIMGNVISNNSGYGIEFKGGTHDNDVYLNCFTDNGFNAYDSGSNNRWDNGTMGNFWGNYTGSDSDGDGIGDVPYNIAGSAGSQDNFPLMKCPVSTPQDGGGIPGYDLFILFGILSVGAIIISKKIKKP